MSDKPQVLNLKKIDFNAIDFDIKIVEAYANIPFEIKRVYWLTAGNQQVERGNHAHVNSRQVLIAICGTIDIKITDKKQVKSRYTLSADSKALLVPSNNWLNISMPPHSVLLCLSSHLYNEQLTIYDPEEFFSS